MSRLHSQPVAGRLHLVFNRPADAIQTTLSVFSQRPPLQVVRAFPNPNDVTLVHIHNVSGGVLGGDVLELKVDVKPGAHAQVTSTGATRVYRHLESAPAALQINDFSVGESGLLEYLPDTLIPYESSRYRQTTRVQLAPDAGFFYWEMIAPGRYARGEIFRYDFVQMELDISANGVPFALERTRLCPQERDLTSLARLGAFRYMATFYVCRVGVEPRVWVELEAQLAETAKSLTVPGRVVWGVSSLAAHGLVVRAVARAGRFIMNDLPLFWKQAKQTLYQQDVMIPRKLY